MSTRKHADDAARVRDNADLADAINDELDRLGWSSETAPDGPDCLDAFPATQEGSIVLIALSAEHDTSVYDGEGVLATLVALQPPRPYAALWQAVQPHRWEEEVDG